MQSPILITLRRYKKIKKQLNELKNIELPKKRQLTKEAIESEGEMHDNTPYEQALQDEKRIIHRIKELESVLSMTQIII